jgi:hypothetical protein
MATEASHQSILLAVIRCDVQVGVEASKNSLVTDDEDVLLSFEFENDRLKTATARNRQLFLFRPIARTHRITTSR